MEAAGFAVHPYQAPVPSFGVWGFALAKVEPFEAPSRVMPGLRYLNDATMEGLFARTPDLEPVPVLVNRLYNQTLVRYYEAEWEQWEE
jgi:spermidine synthase